MDRLFLDANVMFSAAYRDDAGLLALWDLSDVQIISSRYAVEEACRNLLEEEQRTRLENLVQAIEVVQETDPRTVEIDEQLPEKDRPILRAALQARATHLVTGDIRHFGRFFGKRLQGVMVMTPGDYLRSK